MAETQTSNEQQKRRTKSETQYVDEPPSTTQSPDTSDTYLVSADSDIEPTLTVVMPTLNEEGGIEECIHRIKNALAELKVYGEIIVSDSSTDRTPDIAREHGAIVVEPDAPGYGYAYQYAFNHARGEYIAIGDADTTYDFQELPKLYRLVESGEADMAMGSRLDGEIKKGAMPPLHQYLGNPLLTKFLNVFYGAGVTDAHSGMRVISRDALDKLDCSSTGMEYASEMIMQAGAKNLTIREEPITYHPREGEAKLESFSDGWRHIRFMLLNAPGHLFSVPGILMSLIGVLVMALAYTGISLGEVSLGIHSMIAGSLLVLAGYQVTSLGVFATAASNPIQRPKDPVTNWTIDSMTLENGATAGTLVFLAGGVYAALHVGAWITSGFTALPLLMNDIIAFTAIILGLQMVFNSFFISALTANN